jgi:arylsulfatase A-like enzyme
MNPVEFMAEEFNITDAEWSVIKSWYDGAIRYLDHRIADFVETLQKLDRWNETYLIITADHGEMFGEKGLSAHRFSLYDSLLHVPLIIRPPGGGPERKITNPVSLIDLFNTILDMAEIPTREREHSRSLLADSNRWDYTFAEIGNKSKGWLENKYDGVKHSPHHVGPLQCVRDEEFKLIWDRNDSIEMYQWRKDPREEEEISEEYPAERDRLLGVLQKNTLEMREERRYNKNIGEEVKNTLKHLGYR